MQVKIGKIVNSQGVMGEVRVLSNSDFKDIRFVCGAKLWIKLKRDFLEVEIEKTYKHKNFQIIKLKGYNNINDIMQFKGLDIYANAISADDLDDDEYLNSDLVGLSIVDQYDNDLGKSIEIVENPAHNLMRIKHPNNKTYLIPFNDHYIIDVDLENSKIKINNVKGLIDED